MADRRNPKCRACMYWRTEDEMSYYGDCKNPRTKVRHRRDRAHNCKACSQFMLYVESES